MHIFPECVVFEISSKWPHKSLLEFLLESLKDLVVDALSVLFLEFLGRCLCQEIWLELLNLDLLLD